MKKRDFDIAFRGLALGPHEFQYDLDDTFFTLFEYSDYQGLIGKAELMMLKSETVLDLEWRFTGNIEAPCDVTNEVYTQALTNSFAMQISSAMNTTMKMRSSSFYRTVTISLT